MTIINKIKSLTHSESKDAVVLKNVFASFLLTGVALLVSLLSTPAYISYFGDHAVLGVWYTVLSVITWILNFDLGIGNGLRNRLATSYAKGDMKTSKELVSSAYVYFGIFFLALITAGFFVVSNVNWNSIFNIPTSLVTPKALLSVVRCVFIGIMLQFFLRLITSVLYALQKSAVNKAIPLLVSIFQLVFVLVAPKEGTPQDRLLLLSYVYIGSLSIPYIVTTLVLFLGKLKNIRPSIKQCSFTGFRSVMSIGGIIFGCQILYMIIVNTNDFFISHYTSPENVVDYHIYYRLFSLVGTLVSLTLTPLWSMTTKALAEKDYSWVQNCYKRILKLTALVAVGQLLMIVFLQPILNLWLGKETIPVNYLYACTFALWSIVFTVHNVMSTFACGTGKMKTQLICYSIGVAFKLVFLYFVFQKSSNWIYVVISNIALMVPYCLLQHFVLLKEFKMSKKEVNENV